MSPEQNIATQKQHDAIARLDEAHTVAALGGLGTVMVTRRDLGLAFDYIEHLEQTAERLALQVRSMGGALDRIAAGVVPPDQHGHYLAHREAVRIAREAVRAQ